MRCDEFVELVTGYLDGALDTATRDRFAEHLGECDGCDRYLDQIRRTISELGHLPADQLDTRIRDHLSVAFRAWPGR
jgi:anti-sigma factor RsiW